MDVTGRNVWHGLAGFYLSWLGAQLCAKRLLLRLSFQQIGTEAGLLPSPVSRTSAIISPAERIDIVFDFTGSSGQIIRLRSGKFGKDLTEFRVTRDLTDDNSMPSTLCRAPNLGAPVAKATLRPQP